MPWFEVSRRNEQRQTSHVFVASKEHENVIRAACELDDWSLFSEYDDDYSVTEVEGPDPEPHLEDEDE